MGSRVVAIAIMLGCMGIVLLLADTASADNTGGTRTFLPIAGHAAPFDSDPPLNVYRGLVNATLDGDADYYTVRADGSNLTPITDNDVDDNGGLWSPDGAWLAYYNEAGTHLTHLQTGEVRNIGTTPYTEGEWSPNGRYLWWHERDTTTIYLYNLSLDITTTLTVSDEVRLSPRWSSDGRYLAYASADTLWVIAAATPTPNAISTFDRLGMEWSPTGAVLAFSTGPQEGETTYQWDAATNTVTTIVEGYWFVAWFDQGRQLLLGHDSVLYSSDPTGTTITPIYEDVSIYRGVWVDPTNTRLLFDVSTSLGSRYFMMNSEQPGVVEIENRCDIGTYGCSDTYTWSPDGQYLIGSYQTVYRDHTFEYNWIIDTDATPPAFTHQLSGYGYNVPHFLPFSEKYFELADLINVETGTVHVVPLPEGVRPPVAWRYLP